MHTRRFLLNLALSLTLMTVLPSLASAALPRATPRRPVIKPPSVVVAISLSKSEMTIKKASRTGTQTLTAPIVPIRPGTIRAGRHRILRMAESYQSRHGNAVLENVIRLTGEFNIRTSRLFHQWVGSNRPANRAIVLEPETGSLLFSTIQQHGMDRTLVVITP